MKVVLSDFERKVLIQIIHVGVSPSLKCKPPDERTRIIDKFRAADYINGLGQVSAAGVAAAGISL